MRVLDLVPVLLALVWILGPGALLAAALGSRDWVVYVGASAPASIGLLTVAASLLAVVGLPARPVTMAVVLLGLPAVVWFLRRRRAGRPPAEQPEVTAAEDTSTGPGRERLLALVGVGLLGGSAAVSALSWWHGIGPLTTYNQDHDPIHHQVIVAYIERTGRGAPWQVIPIDVLQTAPVHFYPSGMHLPAALTGGLAGGPLVGLSAALIAFCGVAWVLGTGALTGAVLRQHDVTLGWQLASAGATGLAAAGMYRPAFQLVRDNGVMANAVMLVLVPGTVAALLVVRRWRSAATPLAGLACAGAVAVHPSAAVSVGVTFAAVLAGSLVAPSARAAFGRRVVALVGVGVVAIVVASPVVAGALGAGSQTTSYPPDTFGIPMSQSLGFVTTLAFGGFIDPGGQHTQTALFLLLLLGVIGCLLRRMALGLVLAWVLWVAITVSAFWSPQHGLSGPIAGFFYNSAGRIQNHIYLLVPSLAGVALVGVAVSAGAAAGRLRARSGAPTSTAGTRLSRAVSAAVLLVLTVGFAVGPLRGYVFGNSDRLNDRYYQAQFFRVTPDDEAAARWLAGHVSAGQRVMNSANDGSTYAYVRYGVPMINNFSLGVEEEPYTYELLDDFDELDTDPTIRAVVIDMDIAYVYDDSGAPEIGSAYSPGDWVAAGGYSLAPGLQGLADVPNLSLAYRSGEVRIWRVDLDALRAVQQ